MVQPVKKIIHFTQNANSASPISMLRGFWPRIVFAFVTLIYFTTSVMPYDASFLSDPPTQIEYTPQVPIELEYEIFLDNIGFQELEYTIKSYFWSDVLDDWVQEQSASVFVAANDGDLIDYNFSFSTNEHELYVLVEVCYVEPGTGFEVPICGHETVLIRGD